MENRKLGKLPPAKDVRTFKFSSYFDKTKFEYKDLPPTFGHEEVYDYDKWGMLLNDKKGCCVISSMAHQFMLWNKASKGIDIIFSDDIIERTYYDVNGNTEDRGTNMLTAKKYFRKHGMVDIFGKVHKTEAFLKIDHTNWEEVCIALYEFGCVDIGFNVPDYVFSQMDAGEEWSVQDKANYQGGHCVPLIQKLGAETLLGKVESLNCVTWGQEQLMQRGFFYKNCDEAYIDVTKAYLNSENKTPEGLAIEDLMSDLRALD